VTLPTYHGIQNYHIGDIVEHRGLLFHEVVCPRYDTHEDILNKHKRYVGFEVLTAVVINVAIYWDIAPCSLYVNQHFGITYHLATCYMLVVSCSADFLPRRWR
jgi:hypothetical protein